MPQRYVSTLCWSFLGQIQKKVADLLDEIHKPFLWFIVIIWQNCNYCLVLLKNSPILYLSWGTGWCWFLLCDGTDCHKCHKLTVMLLLLHMGSAHWWEPLPSFPCHQRLHCLPEEWGGSREVVGDGQRGSWEGNLTPFLGPSSGMRQHVPTPEKIAVVRPSRPTHSTEVYLWVRKQLFPSLEKTPWTPPQPKDAAFDTAYWLMVERIRLAHKCI